MMPSRRSWHVRILRISGLPRRSYDCPVSDPRSYASGTEKALFLLSQGCCYYPDCSAPVIEMVQPLVPVVNVHIAHICGAKPGSARYDPAMSDAERASFANVILLCKPHHDLVDRIQLDEHPAELLRTWKTSREDDTLAALGGLQGLTEDRLTEMIEHAVAAVGPVRTVQLELRGGALVGPSVAVFPVEVWRDALQWNPEALDGEAVITVTARNTGHLRSEVDSVTLLLGVGGGATATELTLLGRNDYPHLNTELPGPLEVGASASWFASLDTLRLLVRMASDAAVEVAEVWLERTSDLGSQSRRLVTRSLTSRCRTVSL